MPMSTECLIKNGSKRLLVTEALGLSRDRLRIFRIFHPGVFTVIHPPPSFDFKFLPAFLLPSNYGSLTAGRAEANRR